MRAVSLLMLIAIAHAGCDSVLERERFGVRDKQPTRADAPPGSVPREQARLMANLQPPGPQLDLTLLQRGQERYGVFCTPCHGEHGRGDGPVVQRGYPAAATFHSQQLRSASPIHFVNVITNGHGAMPSYGERIPPRDRWAIAAFVKALQLSQHFPIEQLPALRQVDIK